VPLRPRVDRYDFHLVYGHRIGRRRGGKFGLRRHTGGTTRFTSPISYAATGQPSRATDMAPPVQRTKVEVGKLALFGYSSPAIIIFYAFETLPRLGVSDAGDEGNPFVEKFRKLGRRLYQCHRKDVVASEHNGD
jgi:hypothetical protein